MVVLESIEWSLKGDHVMPQDRKKSPLSTLTIQKKFHFSSALARMSTIVQADDSTYDMYYISCSGQRPGMEYYTICEQNDTDLWMLNLTFFLWKQNTLQ